MNFTMSKNFQKSEVKKAIEQSNGYVSDVAKKLKCDWHTAKAYIDKFELGQMLESVDEEINDLAEQKLKDKIKEGDLTAIIFRLKTKGRKRGYSEHQHLSNEVKITIMDDTTDQD